MNIAKLFYFLFFAAGSVLIPFLTLHYQDLGLSGRQIGFLTGIVPLITMVAASFWGMLADATKKYHLLLVAAVGGSWLAVFALSQAETFAAMVPIVCVFAIFLAPIIPLVDNSVMAGLGKRKREYGRVRVWGSYGWGITAAIIGVVIEQTGLSATFVAYLFFMALLLVVAWRLPVYAASIITNVFHGLRTFLTNGRWLLFLSVALIEGMSLGIFLNFLFLYLEEMGASNTVMGLSLTVATLSEIPLFLYSRRLLERWGAPLLLAFSLAATVLRAFAYVSMTAPWQVLPVSLLHGPTFAAMWMAGVAYADETAPAGLGATAQGLFGGVSMGLGVALGAFSGGYLYDTVGAVAAFQWAGLASLIALLIFTLSNREAFSNQLRLKSLRP